MENWNDDRLDELSRRMDAGFGASATKTELTATKEEMNQRFDKIDKRFDRVDHELGRINDRLDKLAFTMLGVYGAFTATAAAALVGSAIL